MGDPEDIYNWRRLDERLTTSGQPTEAQLQAIAALGVECVVNLGLHSHAKALADERASVEALGMDYVHQPVEFSQAEPQVFPAVSYSSGRFRSWPNSCEKTPTPPFSGCIS